MPLFLVKAALTSSRAFFIEAAAKTLTVLSWARVGERGRASPTPSTVAASNAVMRSSILALLEASSARDSAPRSGKWSGHRFVRKRPTRKRHSGAEARLRRAMDRDATLAAPQANAKASPVVRRVVPWA